MLDILERVRKVSSTTKPIEPEEPKQVRITLSVCGCYRNTPLVLLTENTKRIASVLGISAKDLECFAVQAMITGKPEVVACYKQRDVAEEKLAAIEVLTPFLTRPCHSFALLSDK
jgi:hypothetical protein